MSSPVGTTLRRAAIAATRAPSVHNTQPWRMTIVGHDRLELRADHDRRLKVLDPHGRQLMLSCGCALFNARVSLAAAGLPIVVERFPDPKDPDLFARITLRGEGEVEPFIGRLERAIELRQTNRRRFADEHVPSPLLESFLDAGWAEGAEMMAVIRPEDRLAVAALTQKADEIENADPAYRAELRAWVSDDPGRVDGIAPAAIPHVNGAPRDELPIRDFDTSGIGELPSDTHSSLNQTLLLVGSLEDNPIAWLRTGEALERVLLEVAASGNTASFFTQVIEVARTNVLLRQELRLRMHPHVLLRVGKAEPTPPTRRRRLVDVLTER